MVRIAIFQSCSGVDPDANAATLVEMVKQAAQGGAAMLFTPEMSGMVDGNRERSAGMLRSEAEDVVSSEQLTE